MKEVINMSNEEKILEILTTMQQDMAAIKADIETLKNSETINKHTETRELDDKVLRNSLKF